MEFLRRRSARRLGQIPMMAKPRSLSLLLILSIIFLYSSHARANGTELLAQRAAAERVLAGRALRGEKSYLDMSMCWGMLRGARETM